MSVPVRYSAAAEYAVVDSGLSSILQQEEEEYNQHQLQQLYCTPVYSAAQNHNNSNIRSHHHHHHHHNSGAVRNEREKQQQQLMQQRPSMSMSLLMDNQRATAAVNSVANGGTSSMDVENHVNNTMSSSATTAAAAVAAEGSDNAEMRTEWMRMSNEGRYGTPGAASLEYQKYEQQSPNANNSNTNNNNINHDQPMGDNENGASGSGIGNGIGNNNTKSLEDELHALTSEELYARLKEYDVLQDKYHTVLLLPKESRREVTAGGRDGAAYVLRCLKMWYELPSDVLFSAMSLVDRFLDRMAVKPKHMACMSVASFHLAIKQLDLKPIPADDLVTISQCGCTAGDLERMAGVIASKLGVQMNIKPITSVSYLRIYYALFHNVAKEIGGQFFDFYQQLIKLEELENRLEILLCDVKTTVITPSTLALVLICLHLDFHIKESYTKGSPELKVVFEYILFLQQFMMIPDRVFTCGFSIVSGILSHYNGQNKQPYKQRLVWKLSSRTMRLLRPTNRFSSDLPTIEEGNPNALDDGCRSRTESISSEEEEDWPTSAIIPIFEHWN